MYNDIQTAELPTRHASNLTELWWNEEQAALMNLYAVTIGVGQPLYSDYDRFRALCRMMPYMEGHNEAERCKNILKKLGITLPICMEYCDAIWRAASDILLMHPQWTLKMEIEAANDSDISFDLPSMPPPVPIEERFLNCVWNGYEEWRDAILPLPDSKDDACIGVTLEDGFTFVSPHPYRVEQVLGSCERDVKAKSLLVAQLLRILCEKLIKRGSTLHLSVADGAEDAVELLSYLEKSVGLPHMTWSTSDAVLRARLLAYSKQRHSFPILPALQIDPKRSRQEQHAELLAYARVFPKGLLTAIE